MTPEQEQEIARCVFREANDAIIIVQPRDLRLLEVNPAVQRLTGRRRRELLGLELSQLLVGEQASALADVIRAFQSTAQHTASDGYELLCADGSRRPVHVSASRIHIEPEPLGLLVVRDIARLKQMEEERLRLLAQVQQAQKLESLSLFAGGIAHDFNNLLTAILGYTSLALMDLQETNPIATLLHEVEHATRRAADLTGELLIFAGKKHLSVQPLDLSAVVRETLPLAQPLLARLAPLKLDLAAQLPCIAGDATFLRQALLNLLVNAAESMSERGGAVTLRTRLLSQPKAELGQLPGELIGDPDSRVLEAPLVMVEVEDEGQGLAEETRGRIFDPFFSSRPLGRGLGLAAVLGVVRTHGGLIQVSSLPEGGTTFRLLFPVVAGSGGQGEAS